MIYITFERGDPTFLNTTARALAYRTAVQQRQLNDYYAAKDFLLVLHSSYFALN
jgi:hypothetical protein